MVKCICCSKTVSARQQAISCDVCERWQHRKCNTGITLAAYRDAVRGDRDLHFMCTDCCQNIPAMPVNQSALSTQSMNEIEATDIDDTEQPQPIADSTHVLDDVLPIQVNESAQSTNETEADMEMEASFDISHRNIDQPTEADEEPLADRSLHDSVLVEEPLTFTIIETGSQRKKPLFLDNHGYSYGVKAKYKSSVQWRCSVRSKTTNCPATVKQIGDYFVPGCDHIHPADQGRHLKADCVSELKGEAPNNLHRTATSLVEEVMLRRVKPHHVVIPKKDLLVRITNRCRSKHRPSEPKDLNFEIDRNYLQCDDFIVGDIRVDEQRHIFATEQQLRILSSTKRWFIDGTFKVMNEPWKRQGQLFSIHGFVERDGQCQQFPFVFVMMSRKTKQDYVQVFRYVCEKLERISVEGFVADFECAAWLAIKEVFPGIPIKGCVFHWTQAVWRQIQHLGLATTYRQREGMYDYMRQLLALPFLPATHIPPAFQHLKDRAATTELNALVGYIDRQWMTNFTFDIKSWSVFQHKVRTNNDVEGWHGRLNRKAGAGIGFYKLIPLLRREAELVDMSIRGGDLRRDRRATYRKIDGQHADLWAKYVNHELTTATFLRTCGNIYALQETRDGSQ